MSRPELVLIAAVAEKNRVIGNRGELPWSISEDLKRFKRLTTGHAVLMGRKTFQSILRRLGKPLPHRRNIVLSRSRDFSGYPEVEAYPSFEQALEALREESVVYVIGGAILYEKALPLAHRLELTMVEGDYEGDAFFPEYRGMLESRFRLAHQEKHPGYRFETFVRKDAQGSAFLAQDEV
ncbi:MAG: dihydrofolate reductase [Calditrichaeota bacterium]|nr:MAG: dihydrofolate reductase [Calditrichota bacterium]